MISFILFWISVFQSLHQGFIRDIQFWDMVKHDLFTTLVLRSRPYEYWAELCKWSTIGVNIFSNHECKIVFFFLRDSFVFIEFCMCVIDSWRTYVGRINVRGEMNCRQIFKLCEIFEILFYRGPNCVTIWRIMFWFISLFLFSILCIFIFFVRVQVANEFHWMRIKGWRLIGFSVQSSCELINEICNSKINCNARALRKPLLSQRRLKII